PAKLDRFGDAFFSTRFRFRTQTKKRTAISHKQMKTNLTDLETNGTTISTLRVSFEGAFS
ncbi:hypothetical protein N8152_00950, partial [bacterium]|nr:hypothetical protein [bacterium]